MSRPKSEQHRTIAIDLSECEREPIHISGAIQPHGCLFVCRLSDWVISHVSANAAEYMGLPAGTVMLGQPMDALFLGKALHDLRNTLQAAMLSATAERLLNVLVRDGTVRSDVTVHASDESALIELTPSHGADTTTADPIVVVKSMIGRINRVPTLARFLQIAANQLRSVTGYDRVMVYQFLPDDSGQVVAESLRQGLAPYQGLRYPASDIPAQARALYRRQWLRMIVDVDYTPVPIVGLPEDDRPVDLSLASLRSVSPVHLEYLRNMGSGATLTVSLIIGGELWGLISCHHEVPRRIAASTLAAAELFGQIFSLQIEARARAEEQAHSARGRDALDRLIAAMPVEDTVFDNLPRFEVLLRDLLNCDGVGIWAENRFTGVGAVPPASAIQSLIDLLDRQEPHELFVTSMLSEALPPAAAFADRVAGLIAIPFSRSTRDYLMFFRREVIETVTWGGNPNKPVEIRAGQQGISPRKSFEAWRELVRGRATPWQRAEIDTAAGLRVSLLDVILRRSDLLNMERRAAQESQSLIIAELNHRVKNVLALIRSLVRQSSLGAQTLESFTADLENRIRSLAFAHDQLTQVGWNGAPLRQLLAAEVEAWAGRAADRVTLAGPSVTLGSRAYQTLALVFHEMMTNAAKYGALSNQQGELRVEWQRDEAGDLHMTWAETGGPPVQPPQRRGFGTVIMEQTIPFELQGECRIDYAPTGVLGTFRIPAAHIIDVAASDVEEAVIAEAVTQASTTIELNGKRLMLVEDSMMIALDAQAMLDDAGLEVEIASNVADALRALKVNAFDLAVLDVNLSGETSFPIADALVAAKVPFVFATGYGESLLVPERFADVAVVAKPYDERSLRKALSQGLI